MNSKSCGRVLPSAAPILTWSRLHCSNKVCPGRQHVLTTGGAHTQTHSRNTGPDITHVLCNNVKHIKLQTDVNVLQHIRRCKQFTGLE